MPSGTRVFGPIVLPAGADRNHAEALPALLTVAGGAGHFDMGKRTLSGRSHEDTVLVSEQRGFSLDRQLRGTRPLGELTRRNHSARFLPCVSMAITRYTATMTVRPIPLAEKSAQCAGAESTSTAL